MNRLPVLLCLVSLFVLTACQQTRDIIGEAGADRSASATVEPINGGDVGGEVFFDETGNTVRITGTINGLDRGKHGFHIHEGTSCDNRGGHYNPTNQPHGSPDEVERHLGDLGNLVAGSDGRADYRRIDRLVTLRGSQSVVGHVLVIHQGEDEYLPQPSGSAGTEIGCGVIELDG